MHLLKDFIYFLSFDFFLQCPCTAEQWLAYHSLRNRDLGLSETGSDQTTLRMV
jgi:hypothetical protein